MRDLIEKYDSNKRLDSNREFYPNGSRSPRREERNNSRSPQRDFYRSSDYRNPSLKRDPYNYTPYSPRRQSPRKSPRKPTSPGKNYWDKRVLEKENKKLDDLLKRNWRDTPNSRTKNSPRHAAPYDDDRKNRYDDYMNRYNSNPARDYPNNNYGNSPYLTPTSLYKNPDYSSARQIL